MGYFAKVRVASSNLVARSKNPLVTGGFPFRSVHPKASRPVSGHIPAIRGAREPVPRALAAGAADGHSGHTEQFRAELFSSDANGILDTVSPWDARMESDSPVAAVYALNLFDLADNDSYRAYSRRSRAAVERHGGQVVALGQLSGTVTGDVPARQVMVLVEWSSRAAFDAFIADPELADLHPLREDGTDSYLWWLYDRLEDLRPLFHRSDRGSSDDSGARRP